MAALRRGGRALWLSGLCWAVMFTAFMVALTLTTVANVLVTMAIAPLFTALLARACAAATGCRRAPGARSLLAGAGIAWMYGRESAPAAPATGWAPPWRWRADGRGRQLDAAAAPARAATGGGADMLPAVLLGAMLSAR